MSREKTFLVDFVGKSGGGKSTLLPMVQTRLQERLCEGRCLVVNHVRRVDGLKFWALWRYPGLLGYAKFIYDQSTRCIPFYKRLTVLLGRHALAHSPRRRKSACMILYDEGLTHHLMRCSKKFPLEMLKDCPLPHMVVNIQINPVQAAWRKLHRDKDVYENKIREGIRRKQKALWLAKLFKANRADEQIRDYLREWSDQYCRPPLTDLEVADVIEELHESDISVVDQTAHLSHHWMVKSLKSVGVIWMDVDTSDGSSVEILSEQIAVNIWQHYCAIAEQPHA